MSEVAKRKISIASKNQKNKVSITEWSTGRFGKLFPQYKYVDIEKVKTLLHDNKSYKLIAEQFNVTYVTLLSKFKQETGMTFTEYKKRIIRKGK